VQRGVEYDKAVCHHHGQSQPAGSRQGNGVVQIDPGNGKRGLFKIVERMSESVL